MDPHFGVGCRARAFEEVAHADAAPSLARAPSLDARDGKCGLVLRKRAELVPRELERPAHLAFDAQAVVGAARRLDHAGGRPPPGPPGTPRARVPAAAGARGARASGVARRSGRP